MRPGAPAMGAWSRRTRLRGAWGRAALRGLACAALLLAAAPVRAEYRAYELEVVDIYDCVANKRERCRRDNVRTGLAPDTYLRTHGGPQRIGVLLLATWMCYGDTSNYEPVCPRPAPRNGKYAPGERVRIKLAKHITDGWEGTVEVAYYQRSVRSNVYGVRFAERQNVYARYYEKDLEKPPAAGEERAAAGRAREQAAGAAPEPGAETGPETATAAPAQPAVAGGAAQAPTATEAAAVPAAPGAAPAAATAPAAAVPATPGSAPTAPTAAPGGPAAPAGGAAAPQSESPQ